MGCQSCSIPTTNRSLMSEFDSLRCYFSDKDEGAQELTEEEFTDLSRKDAEYYISNVNNAKIKSKLQKIYDKAHNVSQGADISQLFEKVNLIVEQTAPRKVHFDEIASHFHSNVRKVFFKCMQLPFESQQPIFKTLAAKEHELMVTEVIRYSNTMRAHWISNELDEKKYVQSEIGDNFWNKLRLIMKYGSRYTLQNEKEYEFSVENDTLDVTVKGKTDHAVRLSGCGLVSMTIEDKAVCLDMSANEVAQAMSQVQYEADQFVEFYNYAPEQFVGLLQNGQVWIAVLRKVERGRVLWNFVESPPAFTATQSSAGCRQATEVDVPNCELIARLIGHAICAADCISDVILFPANKPTNLTTIYEHSDEYDDGDDDEDDDDDTQSGHGGNGMDKKSVFRPVSNSTPAPAKGGAAGKAKGGSKETNVKMNEKKSSIVRMWSSAIEYFVLPLTTKNVAVHVH